MARKRFSTEQIIGILREAEEVHDAQSTCRKHGVSTTTYHRWKRMYGGMSQSEAQKARQLEKENKQLKQLVGDQALAIQVLKEEMKKRGWA